MNVKGGIIKRSFCWPG